MFLSAPFRRHEPRKVSTSDSRDRHSFVTRCRRRGAMGHFITGVDLHIGVPCTYRGFRRAGRNWLYTTAHKTRQVIIGGIFRTAVPYWPRVRRVPLPVDGSPAAFIAFGKGFLSFLLPRPPITNGHRFFRPEKPPASLERNVRHDERFMWVERDII